MGQPVSGLVYLAECKNGAVFILEKRLVSAGVGFIFDNLPQGSFGKTIFFRGRISFS
jgi:hypothetical protein